MASAVCATHREATAVATCARCGRFLCDACAVVRGEETFCDECVRYAVAGAPAGARAKVVAAVGVASVLAFFFVAAAIGMVVGVMQTHVRYEGWPTYSAVAASWVVGLLGVVLGVAESARIGRGHAPLAGRRWVLAGIVLSFLSLGVMSLAALGLLIKE